MCDVKKEKKKSFLAKLIEKLDRKLIEKSKSKPCCGESKKAKDGPCCKD